MLTEHALSAKTYPRAASVPRRRRPRKHETAPAPPRRDLLPKEEFCCNLATD